MVLIEWALGNLPGFIAVLCAFGFIIFIHELGHFLAARKVGIRCPAFAIGFGPRLFGFTWRGTEFAVRLLPFGGFVQMLGEDPSADEQNDQYLPIASCLPQGFAFPARRGAVVEAMEAAGRDVSDAEERRQRRVAAEHVRWSPDRVYESARDVEGNFNDRTIPQRMAVVVGGVTMNFVSALLLFWLVGGFYGLADLSQDSVPRVMKVFPSSPADTAGLQYGDVVEAVDGVPVVSGEDMVDAIEKYPGQPIRLTIRRGEAEVKLNGTPNAQFGGLVFHPSRMEGGLPQVAALDSFSRQNPAEKAGLKAGDEITAVNGVAVSSVLELVRAVQEAVRQAEEAGRGKVTLALARAEQGPVELDLLPSEARPVGKMGFAPLVVSEVRFLDDTTRTVASVAPGSPADRAGLQAGDEIWQVNGRGVRDTASLDEVLVSVARKNQALGGAQGDALAFDIQRGREHVALKLPAGALSADELGVRFEPVTMGTVVGQSFGLIGRLIIAPVTIVVLLVEKVLNPHVVAAGLSGPIGIMQIIFELSDQGLGKFLYIVALINAAVGAFNLIPFPALDGARLLLLGIAGLRRREFDYRLEAKIHYVGLMVLLALVLLVTAMDVQRLWAGMPLMK